MGMGKQITCRKCKGKGVVDSPVMFAGIPGGCFSCAATGKVYVDKFDQYFAAAKGNYYGFSRTDRQGVVHKSINKVEEHDLLLTKDVKATKITEEQARAFFAKYGTATKLVPKA